MVHSTAFTLKSGQEPKIFMNRETEISFFDKRLNKNKIKGINEYLRRLVEKEIINNPKRGMYWINDILLRMYINKLHK